MSLSKLLKILANYLQSKELFVDMYIKTSEVPLPAASFHTRNNSNIKKAGDAITHVGFRLLTLRSKRYLYARIPNYYYVENYGQNTQYGSQILPKAFRSGDLRSVHYNWEFIAPGFDRTVD